MNLDFISFEIAVISVCVSLSVFFVLLRVQILSIARRVHELKNNNVDIAKMLQTIGESLASQGRDHVAMMERFASAARRSEKQSEKDAKVIELLNGLHKDHERVMDRYDANTQRIVEHVQRKV